MPATRAGDSDHETSFETFGTTTSKSEKFSPRGIDLRGRRHPSRSLCKNFCKSRLPHQRNNTPPVSRKDDVENQGGHYLHPQVRILQKKQDPSPTNKTIPPPKIPRINCSRVTEHSPFYIIS